jgi:predicted  nucleic acid-binding Zn-ribbon protein
MHCNTPMIAACLLNMQRQQAKENELRQEVVELQGRERTSHSEVESKNQDIDSIQRELGRLKGRFASLQLVGL